MFSSIAPKWFLIPTPPPSADANDSAAETDGESKGAKDLASDAETTLALGGVWSRECPTEEQGGFASEVLTSLMQVVFDDGLAVVAIIKVALLDLTRFVFVVFALVLLNVSDKGAGPAKDDTATVAGKLLRTLVHLRNHE